MKTNTLILFSLLAAASAVASLALGGCNRSIAETSAHVAPEPAVEYKEGHGLQLSPAATQFVGLQTAEVTSRDVGSARTVAAVPASALLRTVKGEFVFVANGGWFLRTAVVTGTRDGDWIEIKDGLYEGDAVVTHGVQVLWLAEIQAVNGGVGCAHGH